MRNFLVSLTVCFTCLATGLALADVHATREALSGYSEARPEVLSAYDKLVTSWSGDNEALLKAVEYAAEKHQGQTRKNVEATPYIIHPIGVAELLWKEGHIRDQTVLIAALLHDTLEDTDATEEEIETLFGPKALSIIKEVTNDPNLSTRENKQRQIDHAHTMSLDARLVKLADRIYNIRDLAISPPPDWSSEKISEYCGWGEKLLDALQGTNEDLENALKEVIRVTTEINDHKNREQRPQKK